MYPILWLPLMGNLDNRGLSAINVTSSTATFSAGIFGNNLDVIKTTGININMTDDCNENSNGFGVSMFCKVNSSVISGTLFELTCDDITISLRFSGSKLVVLESGKTVCTSTITVSDLSNWGHIGMIFDGTNYRLYLNGEENVVSPGNISVPIFVEHCRIGNGSDSIVGMLFNLKVYNEIPSVRNIIRDYQCMVASYKFDGSGMVGDTYVTECDVSGFMNDAEFLSTEIPLILSNVESKTRHFSVKIPSENGVKIPIKPDTFFINFWIYLEESSGFGFILTDNGELSTSFSMSVTSMDSGNFELLFSVGTDYYMKEIEPLVWHMISLSYQGDNKLDIYIDAMLEKTLNCGFSGNGGKYPYKYDGEFQLGNFPGFISDYKQTLYKLSQSDIDWLKTSSVVIDDKGTVYANDLIEDSDKSFGFNKKGEVVSSSIEVKPSSTNTIDAMKYGYKSGALIMHDYEEN